MGWTPGAGMRLASGVLYGAGALWHNYPVPRKKDQCACGRMKQAIAEMCAECRKRNPYKRTAEHRAKMRAAIKGKPKPAGYVPASKRPEVAAKIAAYWTPERRERQRQIALRNARNPEIAPHFSRRKEDNPNWQHGRRELPYAPGWSIQLRNSIRERDNHQCQDCDATGVRLHVHHIDFGKDNHDPSNLVTLCHPCHFARHTAHRSEQKKAA